MLTARLLLGAAPRAYAWPGAVARSRELQKEKKTALARTLESLLTHHAAAADLDLAPTLRALQDDPSPCVRRSVANHLNDIAKDHPGLVADWLDQHLPGASAERTALLRHASRGLVKQGHLQVLQAFGQGAAFCGQARLQAAPAVVQLGGAVTLTLQLRSTAAHAQTLAIDYAVHHVKADGSRSAKVFKGWQRTLPAHGELTLVKRHALKPITTRRYNAGEHLLSVQLNGRTLAQTAFELQL